MPLNSRSPQDWGVVSNNLSGEGVGYETEITEALYCPDISNVAYPELFRSRDDKFFYQVRVSLKDMVGISGAYYALAPPDQKTMEPK